MPSSTEGPLNTLKSIPGGDDLLTLFGKVPDFGDAEILSLHLNHDGPSTLLVRETLKDVLVTFTLTSITALDLEDFSIQNVIDQLNIRLIHEYPETFDLEWIQPPPPRSSYELKLEPIFGLGGVIRVREIRISLSPAFKTP